MYVCSVQNPGNRAQYIPLCLKHFFFTVGTFAKYYEVMESMDSPNAPTATSMSSIAYFNSLC